MSLWSWIKGCFWMVGVLIIYKIYRFCEPLERVSYKEVFTDIFYEKLLEEEFA